MGRIIKELNNQNIKLNITAVYNAKQTEKILKLINKKTKVIISIFAGRAGDTGKDPVPEFVKSIRLAKRFKNVQILWASVREPYNYLQAKQLVAILLLFLLLLLKKSKNLESPLINLQLKLLNHFL